MSRRPDPSRLLRWYPRAWRERYGEEFVAFLEDRASDGRLTMTARATIVCAGLREHARAAHLSGDRGSPAERVRAGALLVACAWAVFVVAGMSFAKYSEQFDVTVPAPDRALPWGAFRTVQVVAAVAAVAIAIGAVVVLPTFVRFLRQGGWATIRGPVQRATIATGVAAVAGAGLVAWANSLSFAQRNGGDSRYALAVLAWAIVAIATLALWTVAAVSVGRHLPLTRTVLGVGALLAAVLTAAMITITVATTVWWVAMAADAPWFLHGSAPGSSGSGFDPRLGTTVAVMAGAVVVASYGTVRATSSALRLRRR